MSKIRSRKDVLNSAFIAELSALINAGQAANAITKAKKTLRKFPSNAKLHNLIGVAYLHNSEEVKGEKHLERASKLDKTWAEPLFSLGYLYKERRKPLQAMELFRQALGRENSVETRIRFAKAALDLNEPEAVIEILNARLQNLDFRENMLLSDAYAELAEGKKAVAASRKAAQLRPTDTKALGQLALRLNEIGDLDEAQVVYKKVLKINPADSGSIYRLALISKFTEKTPWVRAIENLVNKNGIDFATIANGCFALAKIYEDLGETEDAFQYLERANRSARSVFAYDHEIDKAFFEEIHRVFSEPPVSIADDPEKESSKRALFVLGMPRSGTTLAEQILGAHPKIFAMGEIGTFATSLMEVAERFAKERAFPKCIEEFDGTAWEDLARRYLSSVKCNEEFFTNKLPANYLYIGAILSALPNAKIVHCRRNPMDTCLSIYQQHFARSAVRYGYDFVELAAYYRLYSNLMDQWERLFPGRIHTFNYEAVVNHPREEIERLLDFCGLEWSEACLNFHKRDKVIRTASQLQARQAINKKSVERWRKYEKYLAPLQDALGDLAP